MTSTDNKNRKSHPLELNDADEDEKFYDTYQKLEFYLDDTPATSRSQLPKLPPPKPLPPKPPKRIAPKLPVETEIYVGGYVQQPQKTPQTHYLNNNNTVNEHHEEQLIIEEKQIKNEQLQNNAFLIDIENVGWFYKKDPISSLTSQTSQTNLLAEDLIEANNNTNSTSSNNSTTNSTSSNNNNNNTNATSSNKKWVLFNKWDSFNLEVEFRNMQSKSCKSQTEPKLVQVLNNLYEVNFVTKKCYAIYWKNGRTMSVMRSLWYTDSSEPFEEKSSEEIEKKHVELFKDTLGLENSISNSDLSNDIIKQRAESPNPTEDASSSTPKLPKTETIKEQIGSINIDEGTVTWYSKDEVYWEKNKLSFIDKMSAGFYKFRNRYSGTRIKRGLKNKLAKEADNEEKPKEISHLVFVVHGIAQKLYENSIVKNCEDLRKECEKKLKENASMYKNHRYMFLPVDWRSSLTLDDGIIETITPNSIQMIRGKLNSSALDILYYTSPLFRTEILGSLSSELNRLYELFCQKHPYFKKKYNKVSFVAHSLGSVIIYDIITSNNSYIQFSNMYGEDATQETIKFNHFSHNDSVLHHEYLNCRNRMQEIERQLVKSNEGVSTLGFSAENLFCLGSPLAVFLALRGVRPTGVGNQDHVLPKHLCKRLFNVFHPADPVAYRIEPLILKHYSTKSPIEIHKSSDTTTKPSYKEMNEKRTALSNVDLKSILSKTSAKRKERGDSKSAELEDGISFSAMLTIDQQGQPITNQNATIEQVELEAALDYQLQDSNFELIASLRAHTSYWKSSDIALFIIHQLSNSDEEINNNTVNIPSLL